MTPVTGAGTSALTLSVDTSTNDSYFSTVSPTFLSHCATVPSVTVSPSCGIVIVIRTPPFRASRSPSRGRNHELFLERERVAHRRHVGAGQPPDGRVEIEEGVFHDHRADLGADSAELIVFVDDQQFARLAHALE